jgi:hypothetical protein
MDKEYWNHVLTCSWVKVKKDMGQWKMPPDCWTALEKGMQHYTRNVGQKNKGSVSPFPGTFNTPRNLLKQAFREQDEIGWSSLFKGRVETQ